MVFDREVGAYSRSNPKADQVNHVCARNFLRKSHARDKARGEQSDPFDQSRL